MAGTTANPPAPAQSAEAQEKAAREARKAARAKKAQTQAAQAVKESRFTPDEGETWLDVEGLGDAAICTSKTGFYYVVFRGRGREHAIPLLVIEKLQEAGVI